MRIRTIVLIVLLMISAACAELLNVLQSTAGVPLTEEEVVKGLKEALTIGARNSAERLAAENGYYGDAAIKILLPEEAGVIIDNIDDPLIRIENA